MTEDILTKLARPFAPHHVTWKAQATKGNRAMAVPYADIRAYMDRLDEVCGLDWAIEYEPWGNERIIAKLTINGVTRSSTGEMESGDISRGIGGTVAEAQSLKRAAAMFGLGRYLYLFPTTWADYDPSSKQFTDKAKAKLNGIVVTHFRRSGSTSSQDTQDAPHGDVDENPATDTPEPAQAVEASDNPFDGPPKISTAQLNKLHAVGNDFHGDKWEEARAKWVDWATTGKERSATELTVKEATRIIEEIEKRIKKRNEKQAAKVAA